MVQACPTDANGTQNHGVSQAFDSTFTGITRLSLVLFWMPFAVHFSWQLLKENELKPLRYRVFAYSFCACIALILGSFSDMMQPILQPSIGFSLEFCAFSTFIGWISIQSTYSLLMECLIHRLEIAFENSFWEVKSRTLSIFRWINGIHWTVIFVTVMVQCIRIDCYDKKASGFAHKIGFSRRTHKSCTMKQPPIVYGMVILSGFTAMLMMVSLAWIFITRLRSIIITMLDDKSQSSMSLLIEKSSVVGLVSIVTYLVSVVFLFATGLGILIVVDACLNLVFLKCLFTTGDGLYEKLFGWFVQRWLRSDTQNATEKVDFQVTVPNASRNKLSKVRSNTAISINQSSVADSV